MTPINAMIAVLHGGQRRRRHRGAASWLYRACRSLGLDEMETRAVFRYLKYPPVGAFEEIEV